MELRGINVVQVILPNILIFMEFLKKESLKEKIKNVDNKRHYQGV